jgi:hypothetical protein
MPQMTVPNSLKRRQSLRQSFLPAVLAAELPRYAAASLLPNGPPVLYQRSGTDQTHLQLV